MRKSDRIFVAGHRGLVGSGIVRALHRSGYQNLILKTRDELDLLDGAAVKEFFARERPDYVFLAAARVGGILANSTRPAEFVFENLQIQNNVIHSSYIAGVKKLLFLGSSCIYPRLAPQPIREEHLLTSELEPTNQAYAIAKIAGIIMCQSYSKQYGVNFISAMPTNLYGPNDNFDLSSGHVLPALIRKFHDAKTSGLRSVELWGTGGVLREFLHVDDLADACLFLMQRHNDPDVVNVGTGEDISIRDLALMIREIVGFKGDLAWDTSKPDGTPRKLLDVSRIRALGWHHNIGLRGGLTLTYEWYVANESTLRASR